MVGSSIEKAFQIFDLLENERITVTAEEVAATLGATRSTTYRYLKSLCDAGFLMQFSRGHYALGPRIVELERKIQLSDPLLNASRPPMADHVNDLLGSALILCGLWGERVICLHQTAAARAGTTGLQLRRARGLPFPLFQGAASLAILAGLPIQKRRSIYLRRAREIEQQGQGRSWAAFRDRMQAIREAGFVRTRGTFGNDMEAIAVTVMGEENAAIGSIARIFPGGLAVAEEDIVEGLRAVSLKIRERLGAQFPETDSKPALEV